MMGWDLNTSPKSKPSKGILQTIFPVFQEWGRNLPEPSAKLGHFPSLFSNLSEIERIEGLRGAKRAMNLLDEHRETAAEALVLTPLFVMSQLISTLKNLNSVNLIGRQ
ncbi:MAG: hypothetical protein Ct9H300mP19_02760 [Dehalococcoidia bacterium]|nr:MAG: hypothetical protein Ct9H300mP19_02760 [Dehalococcoidia bacterium]